MRARTPSLFVPVLLAVALAACSGDAEIGTGASPDTTVIETVTDEVTATETETLAAAGPTPTATTDDLTSPSPSDPAEATLAFTTCEADRYTIGYPEDWDVNEPNQYVDACSLFHPGGVETPEQPRDRDFHWAASVDVMAGDYEQVIARDDGNEELSSQHITVDGRDAVVREYRSTGTTNLPEGERWYAYTVDLDGEILVANTSTVGETDYERDKKILDRMVNEELTIND